MNLKNKSSIKYNNNNNNNNNINNIMNYYYNKINNWKNNCRQFRITNKMINKSKSALLQNSDQTIKSFWKNNKN